MNYFEKTFYTEEQNKKDLTWEEVLKIPVYIITKAGCIWQRTSKVSKELVKNPSYIIEANPRPMVLYFFEKETFKGMKGVKLHLIQKSFPRASDFYDLSYNDRGQEDRWVFITPDWKVYDMEGNPAKIKDLMDYTSCAPSYSDFMLLKKYGHDLRIVAKITERGVVDNCYTHLFSPATVSILREVGFDLDTKMMPAWHIQYSDSYFDVPEDSYSAEWFVENLMHPNRVARRKKENSCIKHDYEYYHNLMNGEDFLVFEEDGQVLIAREGKGYYNGITVTYLSMPGRKTPPCIVYSPRGAKKLTDNRIQKDLYFEYRDDCFKSTLEKIINQLLDKRQLLEKTEVFRNFIPLLEKEKEVLNNASLDDTPTIYFVNVYRDLFYILSPYGQKDRVFEETVKQRGLGQGIKAQSFLANLGEHDACPNLKLKTPYGQVGLTKSVYYKLKEIIETGSRINLKGMIIGLTAGSDSWSYRMTKEEYLSKRQELCLYLTSDFLEVITLCNSWGIFNTNRSIKFFNSILRLAGKDQSYPFPEKIAAITRILKKFNSDTALAETGENYLLIDYYHQVDELASLGIDWPQKYEEFSVKNIMWFLGTLRECPALVNWVKGIIPNASFKNRIRILHEIQNQISALHQIEIERAALEELDKNYAPWREQLKKDLEWEGQDIGIFVPETLAELTAEGKYLRHCVGTYKKDVVLRKEGILFLRKLSSPNIPYYTIDVVKNPNGKYEVRQCHGNCNSNPTQEVIEALSQWAVETGKVDEDSIKSTYRALCAL